VGILLSLKYLAASDFPLDRSRPLMLRRSLIADASDVSFGSRLLKQCFFANEQYFLEAPARSSEHYRRSHDQSDFQPLVTLDCTSFDGRAAKFGLSSLSNLLTVDAKQVAGARFDRRPIDYRTLFHQRMFRLGRGRL